MLSFSKLGDANLLAYKNNARKTDIIAKKQEILDGIAQFHNLTPTTILCVGFSSFLFAKFNGHLSVTGVSQEALDYLTEQKVKFTHIPEQDLLNNPKKFQAVIAADEYFTYADSDSAQKDQVSQICNLASDLIITTVRDYKNQDYKDREFSQPSLVRNGDNSLVFLETHTWDPRDRNSWASTVYAINQISGQLTTFGSFARRSMYFKQLAKFTSDSGATSFLVHKNLMYKGLLKKNYEHVITIKFD